MAGVLVADLLRFYQTLAALALALLGWRGCYLLRLRAA
jgi:hypothetical protein